MTITSISSSLIIFVYVIAFIVAKKTKMYGWIEHLLKCFLPIPVYFIFFDCIFRDTGTFAKVFPIPAFVILGALFIFTAYFTFREFERLHKYQRDNSGFLKYELIFIAVKMTVGIIVLFAILNLLIFSMFPNQFTINTTLADYELAFEFLYYSFNVTITYSNSGIEATGVIAKLLQMTHIAVFYFYAAGAIFKLLTSTEKESN